MFISFLVLIFFFSIFETIELHVFNF